MHSGRCETSCEHTVEEARWPCIMGPHGLATDE